MGYRNEFGGGWGVYCEMRMYNMEVKNQPISSPKNTSPLPTLFGGAIPATFAKAQALRANQTPQEKKLWQHIKNNTLGHKFRRQHPFYIFILDFYAHDIGLCIELDGNQHLGPDQASYDKERDNFLHAQNIKTVRIPNTMIDNNIDKAISLIEEAIRELREVRGLI